MFRKINLTVLVFLFSLGIVCNLLANGVSDTKPLLENTSTYKVSEDKIPDLLKKTLPGISFKVLKRESPYIKYPDRRNEIFAVKNGEKYFTQHFNKLWLDHGNKDATLSERMKTYAFLTNWRDTFKLRTARDSIYVEGEDNLRVKKILPVYPKIEVSGFKIWSKKYSDYFNSKVIRGVYYVTINKKKTKWIFVIKKDQIYELKYYTKKNSGSFRPIFYGGKKQRDVVFGIIGGNYESLTVNDTMQHYYIKVSENNSDTGYDITIRISGLDNGENVNFIIKSLYQSSETDSIWVNEDLTANSSGVCEYIWQPTNDSKTGFCEIYIIRENEDIIYWENHYIIPEHTKTGTFDSGYNYEIHYCNQFFAGHTDDDEIVYPAHDDPAGIDHAETFAGYVETALKYSWVKQVNDWNLAKGCSSQGFNNVPIDSVGIYHVYINDSDKNNKYHETFTIHSSPYHEKRYIGIPYDIHLMETFYTTEENRINVGISHEFYHGIQASLNTYATIPIPESMKWLIEGQATMIPTIQYPTEEFDNASLMHKYRFSTFHYNAYWLNESLFQTNSSNKYMSYYYSFFWRFLFENYNQSAATMADSLEIIRKTCQGYTEQIDASTTKDSLNSKINSTDSFNNFDEALMKFGEHIYFNDPRFENWNPCPSNGFYLPPLYSSENTLSRNVRENINIPGAIESSFGLDYHKIVIQDSVKALTVQILKNTPSSSADFGFQAWTKKNGVIIDSFSVIMPDTTSSSACSFRVLNTADTLIVNIIRLDPNEFEDGIDSTYTLNVYPGTTVSGSVSGTWSIEDSPFYPEDDIEVIGGERSTLTIDPGVSVYALGNYKFSVDSSSKIIANGDEFNPITFSAVDTTTGWGGIRFHQNSFTRTESQFSYVTFEYAVNYAQDTYPIFINAIPPVTLYGCGGAIFCFQSSPSFDNCIFRNCKSHAGGGMYLMNGTIVNISNSEFYDNVTTSSGGAIEIRNNEIFNGFESNHTFNNLIIRNNTSGIYGGSAIYTYFRVGITAYGLTTYNNFANDHPQYFGASFYISGEQSHIYFYDGILRSNQTAEVILDHPTNNFFGGLNSDITNGDVCYSYPSSVRESERGRNTYFNNIIDADPMFVDDGSYNLQQTSLCIDGGGSYTSDPESIIDPDGTIGDMGFGYYYQPLDVYEPSEVTISFNMRDSLNINWSQCTGSIFYKIFESDNPVDNFTMLDSVRADTSYNLEFEGSKKFYYVTSGNNRGRTQIRNASKRKIDLAEIHKNMKKRF
ncbi:MAG: hypothetical protein K8S23_07330 [Candidatus Cloacimonetes bacterium]|nr:hypothetical protein [Candidatus Cloacimonadota bacterium]